MHKVITLNLNGNAYQLDEPGYEALRDYLARAERELEGNPDRAEILADLEQAIADKCGRYLAAHKTVITTDEVARIIEEMGPVDPTADAKEATPGAPASEAHQKTTSETPPKRLYRIPAGSMVAGVCTGIGAYANIDVTLVRFGFVIAALLTKGLALIAYVALMFVMPEATSPEEAAGAPLNAKEVVDRARRRSADATREWRRNWRRQQKTWRRQWPGPGAPPGIAPSPLAAALLPVFGLMHMALFLVMIAAMISLVNTGAILNWRLPPDIPVWAGALILLVAYQFVVSPLRVAQQWTSYPGAVAFWNAVAWMIGIAFAIWLASSHIPEIRAFLHRLPDLFKDFGWAMRDFFAR